MPVSEPVSMEVAIPEVAQCDTGIDKNEINKAVVGIIYPPPELRNIVDKTASFVARNGPEFETRIKANEQGNRKFNFLKEGDPYHAYYLHKVKDFIEGKAQEPVAPQLPDMPLQKKAAPASTKKVPVYEPIILKDPPPETQFMLDPPSISALELDVVKLTAQFVAKNGKSFLQSLIQKEQRNFMFDFLRPQHGFFQYFTKLVEQYSKILLPEQKMLDQQKKEVTSNHLILDKVMYRVEWEKYQERVKKKAEDDREKERQSFSQIDWHDFVVVETIEFPENESGDLPPPVTPDELGARLIAQERYERMKEHPEEFDAGDSEEEKEADNDVEMDVDSSSEDDDFTTKLAKAKDPNAQPEVAIRNEVAEAQKTEQIKISNLKVRKDYNPKAAKGPAPTAEPSDQWLVSPITGERVRADKMQEHMRVALLDPRWREQRDRANEEKKRHEDPYAPGNDVINKLKQFAERRTDIFGKGGEETMIGKKMGEEESKVPDSVQWDGHSSSMESAIAAAKKNVTIDDQIEANKRSKGIIAAKDSIGPLVPGQAVPNAAPPTSAPPTSAPPTSAPPASVPPTAAAPPAAAAPAAPVPGQRQPMQLIRVPLQVAPGAAQAQAVNLMQQANIMQHAQLAQAAQQQARIQQVQQAQVQAQVQQVQQAQVAQQRMMQQQLITQQLVRNAAQGLQAQQQAQAQQNLIGLLGAQQQQQQLAQQLQQQQPGEQASKRVRLDEPSLVPEDEWLARHGGQVSVKVKMPVIDAPDSQLKGQVISIDLSLSDTVNKIKGQITEETGLPAGKQKIQTHSGIFLKDTNSLAYFNVSPDTVLSLTIKERGGKRK